MHRVLDRGEAVDALKCVIYTDRVATTQARRADEMQAVTDALELAGQHRDGVEHGGDARRHRPLGQQAPSRTA